MATFVLVHGAFQGGWVWGRVDEALAELGHVVHRPTLSGCGLHRGQPGTGAGLGMFAQEIVQYLKDECLINVTLVGHSYAGLICSAVAGMLPDVVSRLILVDGVLPVAGKSFADMGGEPFAQMLEAHAVAGGLVRPWPLESFGVPSESARWFEGRLGMFPMAAFTERYPSGLGAGSASRAYISCIPAKSPLLRAMAARAEAEGWEVHALMSGHCAMVAAPLELAGQLQSIVRADPQTQTADAPGMPRLDRRLLEDMRRQVHWTCRRLAQEDEAVAGSALQTPRPCGD